MLTAVSAFLLAGYTLVYAAIANGGSLARDPLLALTHDAYAVGENGQASTSTASTFDSILGWVGTIAGWATDPEGHLLGLLP